MPIESRAWWLLALLAVAPVHAQNGIYAYTANDGTLHLSDVADDSRYRLILKHPEQYKLRAAAEERVPTPPAAAIEPVTTHALEKKPYNAEIVSAARANGLDPALIHAVINAESAYNAGAVSKKGAVGLMQLMPDTALRYGVRDRRDPRQNIDGGTRYLNDLTRLFNGDLLLVLAAYNAGENAVLRHGKRIPPYAETVQYVPRVLDLYRRNVRASTGRHGLIPTATSPAEKLR